MTTAHHGRAFHGGEHYENFPVGSWLVPKTIRRGILLLYRFARTGDDLADEGEASKSDRIIRLKALRDGLQGREQQEFAALATIGQDLRHELNQHQLPSAWADDLIEAFLRDVDHHPMPTEEAVLDYCRYSAAPVGRIVLGLAGLLSPQGEPQDTRQASDSICMGLQLANFAQDMGQDIDRGRYYFPTTWWPVGWSPALGRHGLNSEDQRTLPAKMATWALTLLDRGAELPRVIRESGCKGRWRLALEIAITVEGGREICRQVLANPAAVWQRSPSLSRSRLAVVVFRAIRLL